jgi:hypothetical protein
MDGRRHMRTPDKIQEACDRLGTRGSSGIIEVYGTMSDQEKERRDQ